MDITEEMITAAYTTYCTSLNFAENKREAMKMALESVLVLMEKEALKQLTEKEDELFHKRLAGNLNMCQKCKGIGPENKLHECLSQQEKEAIERANEAFRNHLFRTNMLLLTSNYMKEQNLAGMGALSNPYANGLPENNTGWPLFETKTKG